MHLLFYLFARYLFELGIHLNQIEVGSLPGLLELQSEKTRYWQIDYQVLLEIPTDLFTGYHAVSQKRLR